MGNRRLTSVVNQEHSSAEFHKVRREVDKRKELGTIYRSEHFFIRDSRIDYLRALIVAIEDCTSRRD
jgi:hypothetical protein